MGHGSDAEGGRGSRRKIEGGRTVAMGRITQRFSWQKIKIKLKKKQKRYFKIDRRRRRWI